MTGPLQIQTVVANPKIAYDLGIEKEEDGFSPVRHTRAIARLTKLEDRAATEGWLKQPAYAFAKFQIDLKGNTSHQAAARTIPTFLTLYIFGFIYQLVLVWDALRLKNTIQVIGLCMYNVGLLIYGAVQLEQIKEAVDTLEPQFEKDPDELWKDVKPFLIAIPCILGFGTAALSGVAWKLYDEFAWTIYKHISADLRMKRRYLTFQIYIALLKFDFFFFLGFTVQFVVIVTDKTDVEFALTIAAIPVTIAVLLLAAYFTRIESRLGMAGIIIIYFGALAYFLFKLIRMYEPSHEDAYLAARRDLTSFAVITIVLILCTITNAILCTLNFNKGLKPHVAHRKLESDDEKANMTEMQPHGLAYSGTMNQNRMEID
ncbi:MAG: hypothetical protein Q9227_000516 [Pyrenula ochraceoflavens]